MTREASIAAAIDAELRAAGAYVVNVHGTAFGRTGIPDRLACVRGLFLAVEIKAPGGRVSAVQRWELRQIERAGGIAIVARSRADVRDALRAIDERVDGGAG